MMFAFMTRETQRFSAEAQTVPAGEEMAPPLPRPEVGLFRAAAAAHFKAAFAPSLGFAERLVWFWSNHFAVARRNPNVTAAVDAYNQEAIRAHVVSRFADMLIAVETHPVMLTYLDAHVSIGPNSPRGLRTGKGLNENLAR